MIRRMSFFAVLFALLIEQVKPLPRNNPIHDALIGWVRWTGRNFDAGRAHHAWIVWIITVPVPAALVAAVHVAIAQLNVVAALVWNVVVLYLTLGFRQFSHYFTDIREALERGDDDAARRLLAQWRHLDATALPRSELLRHVIEHSLLAAHRHVFGVFFWFIVAAALGLGPAGAVLYRMAEFASRYWAHRARSIGVPMTPRVLELSQHLFRLIDHVPARLTAFGFAVVGDFEQAVSGWRRDAALWQFTNEGVILAAAAGAVGVRLGGQPAPQYGNETLAGFGTAAPDPTVAEAATPGLPPRNAHLDSVVGLVWRSVVLWMLLVALLTLANLLG
jgi:adenosylcobinamide-phosphate synthase